MREIRQVNGEEVRIFAGGQTVANISIDIEEKYFR